MSVPNGLVLDAQEPRKELERVENKLKPTKHWGRFNRALPTNVWWTNFILDPREQFDQVQYVPAFPYNVLPTDEGLSISYDKIVFNNDRSAFVPWFKHFGIETVEPTSRGQVVAYDKLTVTLRWPVIGNEACGLNMTLLQGCPYVTARFDHATPKLAWTGLMPQRPQPGARVNSTTRFTVQINNGYVWKVYSSAPISWRVAAYDITASVPFTGVVRVALAAVRGVDAMLDAHADTFAVGGDWSADVDGDVAVVVHNYSVQSMTGNAAAPELLMLALPHHFDMGLTNRVVMHGMYGCIRGAMTAVVGNMWRLVDSLPPLTWHALQPPDADKLAAIRQALEREYRTLAPRAIDLYVFMKELAGMGALALIAEQLGEHDKAHSIRCRMVSVLQPWLAGKNQDRLLYDTSYGGIIPIRSHANWMDDYGAAYYNDHHYQYGYLVYAAAVLAKHDTAWYNNNRTAIEEFVRDYANPSTSDPWFPFCRNKDFYAGHSWAGGLFPFGKNQESLSEGVNAYYALAMLGVATNNASMAAWGRVLMSMEIRAGRRYWHLVPEENCAHLPPQCRMWRHVGIVWDSHVDYSTWFGLNVEYIHAISYIPFTPMAECVLHPRYIAAAWPVVSEAFTRSSPPLQPGWRGYLYMAHAIIDKDTAWQEVLTLPHIQGFVPEHGTPYTLHLYWVATRPRPEHAWQYPPAAVCTQQLATNQLQQLDLNTAATNTFGDNNNVAMAEQHAVNQDGSTASSTSQGDVAAQVRKFGVTMKKGMRSIGQALQQKLRR